MLEKLEMSLSEIKLIETDLLKHLKEFCINHDLRYFLSNGTLLGAIKYKGFIPWDDDIDVFLPRKDYDYLIDTFVDYDQYKLFSPERVGRFGFPFAKLCNMNTRREELNNNNGVELGVDIDIFPLDYIDNNYFVAKQRVKKQFKRMQFLNYSKNISITASRKYKIIPKKMLAYVCKVKGAKFFVNKLKKNAKRVSGPSNYVGCLIWPVYGIREIVSKEIFEESVDVVFENEVYPAPIGYDTYLHSLYGEYKQELPVEKQKSHHHFKAYKWN